MSTPAISLLCRLFLGVIGLSSSANLLAQLPTMDLVPSTIAMCEDTDGCSNWSFSDQKQGTGKWADGAVANLTVEQFTPTSLVVRREDPTGAAKGLTALYTGTRKGFLIEGMVTYTFPGQASAQTNWHAILAPPPPIKVSDKLLNSPQFHYQETAWLVCEDFTSACAGTQPPTRYLWTLGKYYGNVRYLSNQSSSIGFTIDHSGPDSIAMRRTDFTGTFAGMTSLYIGTVQGSSMKGTAIWIWPGKWQKPLTGNWVARSTPKDCDEPNAASLSGGTAKNVAGIAYMVADKPAAFRCLLYAAETGDADAQNAVGTLYTQGDGTPRNYGEALAWFSKSGQQNNKQAMLNLSLMYRKGLGTPVDSLKADFIADLASERQRQLDLGAKVLQPGLGSLGFLIGILAGAPPVDTSKDPFLDFRVTHEGDVIARMGKGMTRVQAEEETYKEEDKARRENHFKCSVNDFVFGPEGPTQGQHESSQDFTHRRAVYDKDQRENPACPTGESDAIDTKNREYLECVHQFIDSEKIQAHCHLF